ncbi:hypothetical protein F511_10431 [Dorcoceras hygrometricum]|uniref:Acyl-CoA dehydrogenase-related protein n=1 Tax=Dorcoceras hygrometricum TaxID=472368 RepID=A0A2Z7CE18_9LAMI|nr:hypothetical protein F511_10431 [Dorcoceras hygrometricum]
MSLFDLQDVRIAIGSIATLDLPMVVDLIGIYGLKGPYCTLTMTDWFFQALSVIPRGSWGDVARRFTMIRWAAPKPPPPSLKHALRRLAPPPPRVAGIRSGRIDEENPFVQNSSVFLLQPDEGVSVLVVDRIGDYLPQSIEKSRVLVIPVGARHKCQQGIRFERPIIEIKTLKLAARPPPCAAAPSSHRAHLRALDARWPRVCRARGADGCCNRRKKLRQRATCLPRCVRPMVGAALAHDGATRGRSVRRPGAVRGAMISPSSRLLADVMRAGCCVFWSWRCAVRRRAMACDGAALVAAARAVCVARDFSVGGAAAGRPSLRRISGDVVTAGLSSSRVWFGPVPGSP